MKRTFASVVIGALMLAACGGGGDDKTTSSTTEPTTATTEQPSADQADTDENSGDESAGSEPTRAVATSLDGDLILTIESNESSIWMTTDAEVCSPAEPAVAVIAAVVEGADAHDLVVEASLTQAGDDDDDDDDDDDAGDRRSVDFVADRDDAEWRAVVGPFEATRSSRDRQVEVAVTVRTRTGEQAVAVVELEVLAPERCENDDAERRPSPPASSLDVRTDPTTGVIVGSGVPDCAQRDTQLGLGISTRGPIVALTVSGNLPDGTTLARSLTPGSNVRARLGPFRGGPDMPDASPFTLTVAAIDALGRSMTEQVTATLVRPEACESTTSMAPTTTSGETDPGIDQSSVSVVTSPNPAEVWAAATGFCPAGPTTFSLTVEAPSAATAVGVEARSANGEQVRVGLTRSGDRWTGTVGPFAGWSGMADSSALDVRVSVAAGSKTLTIEVPARLRRSASCGDGATTSTAPATTSTTTVPPTTPATTTSSTTTTTPATTTTLAPIEVTGSASPGQVTASGPCTDGTVLTISATTSGPVTEVGAQVTLATGASQNVPLSGGPGSWSAPVGPFPGSANMPEQSPISITVVARDGAGRTTTATTGATLLKPPAC